MRLLRTSDMTFVEVSSGKPQRYAILSHRWASTDEEISYQDLLAQRKKDTSGWHKVVDFCAVAREHKYNYCWIDTCCIDKTNNVELSEAINSMFKWYRKAGVCFAYLADVDIAALQPVSTRSQHALSDVKAMSKLDTPKEVTAPQRANASAYARSPWQWDAVWQRHTPAQLDRTSQMPTLRYLEAPRQSITQPPDTTLSQGSAIMQGSKRTNSHDSALLESEWFTRGWTLQELIAPKEVVFFDRKWRLIGTRSDHYRWIASKTRIAEDVLLGKRSLSHCSIGEKFCWASDRKTTRPEDESYCLLGLLGVEMPLIYGEGRKAFVRLQETLLSRTNDYSFLAWTRGYPVDIQDKSLLAPSLKYFIFDRMNPNYGPLTKYNTGRIKLTFSSGYIAIDIVGMDLHERPADVIFPPRRLALPIATVMDDGELKYVVVSLSQIDIFTEWRYYAMDVIPYLELYPPTSDPVPAERLHRMERIYVEHKPEQGLLSMRLSSGVYQDGARKKKQKQVQAKL